ncbi:hypothetical protein BD779DRAFT_1667491 [Infundibulicybe gibba]|nr:hypothetical protein BD779DRAFT_1667491 [Infundibulicybe gibba]
MPQIIDILLQLQNVGPRVRKSVTEGYAFLPPSQHRSPAMRSVSMGTIFRSANDTLHEVFFTSTPPTTSAASVRKRSHEDPEHSESEGTTTDHEDPKDQLTQLSLSAKGTCPTVSSDSLMKPTNEIKPTIAGEKSEEDWSIPGSRTSSTFEPTVL